MPLYAPAASEGLTLVGVEHFESHYDTADSVKWADTVHNEVETGIDRLNVFMGSSTKPMGDTDPFSLARPWDPDLHTVEGEQIIEQDPRWPEHSWWGTTEEDWAHPFTLGPGFYQFQSSLTVYDPGSGAKNNSFPSGYFYSVAGFDAYEQSDGGGEFIQGFDHYDINYTPGAPIPDAGNRWYASGTLLIPDGDPWYISDWRWAVNLSATRVGTYWLQITFDIEKYV